MHLQHYAAHIHFAVVRRRDSFQRALEPFNLEQPSNVADLKSGQRRSTGHSFFGGLHRMSDGSLGMEKFELDRWDDIEENDPSAEDDAFEISPYRFLTKV